ncbi:MAG: hypothetical protein WCJ31_15130 [Planctomycetia bacterium]
MANILAAASGNWSATGTWIGGALPTSSDIVYANGFTVAIDQNITVVEIRADSNGGVATNGGGFTVAAASGVTRTIAAKLTNSNVAASPSTGGVINTSGALTSASSHAITFSGTGTVNVTGAWSSSIGTENQILSVVNVQLTGNFSYSGPSHGIGLRANASVFITGDVSNLGTGSSGILNASTSSVLNVVGTVTGGNGSTSPGVWQNGGSSTISRAVGGTAGPGVLTGAGSSYITRAAGGVGAVGVSHSVGVTYVEEIEYGPSGMSPTAGVIRLTDKTSNKCLFYRQGLALKTVADIAGLGVLPAATDVRSGVSFNSGQITGTCAVPSAGSVALGVSVDATTGTAILTSSAIESACSSALNAFASGRLVNVATTATTGQQIADATF